MGEGEEEPDVEVQFFARGDGEGPAVGRELVKVLVGEMYASGDGGNERYCGG